MSNNDISLNSFPNNRTQALAMLYTQNQDLKDKSPCEVTKIYLSAHTEIHNSISDLSLKIKKDFKSNPNV